MRLLSTFQNPEPKVDPRFVYLQNLEAAIEEKRKELNALRDTFAKEGIKLQTEYEITRLSLQTDLGELQRAVAQKRDELAPLEKGLAHREEALKKREREVDTRERIIDVRTRSVDSRYDNLAAILEDVSDRLQKADELEFELIGRENATDKREGYLIKEEARIEAISNQKLTEISRREEAVRKIWEDFAQEKSAFEAERKAFEEHKAQMSTHEADITRREKRLHAHLKKFKS